MSEELHHRSRWRRCKSESSGNETTEQSQTVSLRYLDEFVRKLQCAPQLLEYQLYPDAKEITESMGLFNAVWQCMLRDLQTPPAPSELSSTLADCIIVVGDGNTPRTATMFAYRIRDWKCYSIDPALETPSTSPRAHQWKESITNLIVVPKKIEQVEIHARRAILVLVHAHVTLEQALGAVHAQEIIGLVTVPCCNWYGKQELLWERLPDIVFDDPSILSDHREVRVWRGEALTVTTEDILKRLAGCRLKEFVGDEKAIQETTLSKKQVRKAAMETVNGLSVLSNVLSQRIESFISLEETQRAHVTEVVKKVVEDTTRKVLILGTRDEELINGLRENGFVHLYVVEAAVWIKDEETLKLTLSSRTSEEQNVVVTLQCPDGSATSVLVQDESSPIRFDYIIDILAIYTSIRDQPRRSTRLFSQLVHSLVSLLSMDPTSRLLTLSPRKDWHKSMFLSHPPLGLDVVSTDKVPTTSEKTLYLYTCKKTTSIVSKATKESEEETRARILQLKSTFARDFIDKLDFLIPLSPLQWVKTQPIDTMVRVQGIVQHIRQYSRTPSFFSIQGINAEDQIHIKVVFDSDATFHNNIFRLLHKLDYIEIMGWMDWNNQKEIRMIRLHALYWIEKKHFIYQ